MAGDWVKIECVTPDKPEIFRMADILSLDPDSVVGKLVRVWVWADQQSYDGNEGSVTLVLLDRLSGVTGFGKAMIDAGWITEESHGLVFPNFDRHNGEPSKQRALTSKRVAKHRAKKRNDAGVTKVLPEKRREESLDSSKEESFPEDLPVHPADKLRTFPMQKGVWKLPQKKYDEYEAAYADKFDLVFELNKARQWLLDHKDRRPRASMAGFLTRWLNKVLDFRPRAEAGSRVADDLDGQGVYNAETGEIVKPMDPK